MRRLIPFLRTSWPGRSVAPAVFFVLASAATPALGDSHQMDSRPGEGIPYRPTNTGEFLKFCKQDALYCEDQFAAYAQRYAAVRVEELAQQESYRQLRERLRDPNAFDGICLPRERLLTNDFPQELVRGFRRWAEQHRESHAERVPVGVKAAMQALYPCS